MADEQYKWLDRDAAERLLRGEPLEAVDADARKQADRLAEALGTLAAEAALSSAELPGEAAALAAFRGARTGRDGEEAFLGRRGRTRSAAHSGDAGLIRLGRSGPGGRRAHWGRPVRIGLAAALAAGMIGGVAVAAGTGALPTPFRDHAPTPGTSVSAAVTSEQPLLSPSPGATAEGGVGAPTPDGTTNGPTAGGSASDEAEDGGVASGRPGASGRGKSGRYGKWRGLLSSCRDFRRGKELDRERRRALEDAAQGSSRVRKYCEAVLGGDDHRSDGDEDRDKKSGKSGKGDKADSNHIFRGTGDHAGDAGVLTPAPTVVGLAKSLTTPKASPGATSPAGPNPSPPYSALPLP
ncbi:hypothetical protein [Streptomyces sp. NPDC058371]|uniref:hypothetical protein n=1 Tax=Streptomyces sp. NPDC058371 TaxID=3346463 RepID=UPI003661573E